MIKKLSFIFLLTALIVQGGLLFKEGGAKVIAKEEINLPPPKIKGAFSLEEAILKRRSKRSFLNKDLSLEQISRLLWAAQGITETYQGRRAAPSAGATYPLEVYAVKAEGVYRYLPEEYKLTLIIKEDRRKALAAAALGQSFIAEAPLDIVIAAVYQRTRGRYGERAERYVHMECGHAAQNLHLQAVALGLGSVPIGAFSDKEVKNVLGFPRDHEPIYIIPVGYAR